MTSRGVGLLNFSTIAGGIFPNLTRVEWRDCFWQIFGIGTTCCHKDNTFFFWASYIHLCRWNVAFFFGRVATVLILMLLVKKNRPCFVFFSPTKSHRFQRWIFPSIPLSPWLEVPELPSDTENVVLQVPLPDGALGFLKVQIQRFVLGKKDGWINSQMFFFKDAVRFQLHFMNP